METKGLMSSAEPFSLRDAARQLVELLESLEIQDVPREEVLDSLLLTPDTRVDPARLLGSFEKIAAAIAAYDTALSATLRFEYPEADEDADLERRRLTGQVEVIPLDSEFDRQKLEEFVAQLPGGVQPVLDLGINKGRLVRIGLEREGLAVPKGTRPALVLGLDTLAGLFRQGLQEIEKLWDAAKLERLVILAPAWRYSLTGRYLAVIGGDPVAGWRMAVEQAAPSGAAPPPALTPQDFQKVRHDDLWWETPWVTHLTPLHLAVEGAPPARDPVAQALRAQFVNLCILFTADRVEGSSGWRAVYSGAGERTVVSPAGATEIDDEAAVKGVGALSRLVWWTYEGLFRRDRLAFLQSAVARILRPFVPDGEQEAVNPCRKLLLSAGAIRERLEPDWKMFIDGRLEKFGAQVRALKQDVSATVDTFSNQIGAMIKSLSDTMLAAVGILLGAYIAALFKKDLLPEILAFSVAVYIVYLLIFPLGYNMSERLGSYRALHSQFQVRRQRFERDLSTAEVQLIVGSQVEKSERRFRRWFALVLATYLIVALVLWSLVPSPIDAVAYEAPQASALAGPLQPNEALRTAALVGEGRLDGAEDVAVGADGRLYTGTADGRIVRITLQPDGEAIFEIHAETGGRPLGLHFAPDRRTLYVADAVKGLLAIDETGGVKTLATAAGGVPFGFANDLDVAADGTIYFSDASSRFGVDQYLYDLLEARPRGRLLAYVPRQEQKGEVRVLLDGLSFANGVALDRDERFVLVAETYRYRIRRYWLAGAKAGRSDVFVDRLPGFPDNLARDPETGRFWVAFYTLRNPALDYLHLRPFLKDQIAKLPKPFWPKPAPYGLVVEFDSRGRPMRSLHDPGGQRARAITSVDPYQGKLYLGSLDDGLAVWDRGDRFRGD